jgi:hypothetical protein
MPTKNLKMKSALKPVSETDLENAAGGRPRPTFYGCCSMYGHEFNAVGTEGFYEVASSGLCSSTPCGGFTHGDFGGPIER